MLPAVILSADDPVGTTVSPSRVVRVLVSAPAFAAVELQAIDEVFARINMQFLGLVRLEVATGGAGIPGAIACDTVLVLLRPRLDGDPEPSAEPARGTTVSLSAAVDRPVGVAPPDLFIFGHSSGPADDDGWETRKQGFRAWFASKGGDYLVLDRYASAAELSTKVETQFNMWLTHAGFSPPIVEIDEPDVVEDAPPAVLEDAPLVEAAVQTGQPAIEDGPPAIENGPIAEDGPPVVVTAPAPKKAARAAAPPVKAKGGAASGRARRVAAPAAPSSPSPPAETPTPAAEASTEAVALVVPPRKSKPSLPEVLADALGLVAGLEPVSEVAITEKPRTARYRAPRRGVAAKASPSDNRV